MRITKEKPAKKLGLKPKWDEIHFINAIYNASRSTCIVRQVGAELVAANGIDPIQGGYNGTPEGMPNCDEGVCVRCAGGFPPGVSPELCICQHAERNAFGRASRRGISTEKSVLYVTARPCGLCLKEAITHGTVKVVYLKNDYPPDAGFQYFTDLGNIEVVEYNGPMEGIEAAKNNVKTVYGRSV